MAERARPAARATVIAYAIVIAIVACATVAITSPLDPTRADAQAPPSVEIRVDGVFGNEALLGDAYAPIAIELRNVTRQTLRGRLVLEVTDWSQPPDRHALAIDLPPGETRRVVLTVFVGAGATLSARYEVDGARLGAGQQSAAYAPGGRSLVIVSDPPRLRASLLDLQVSVPDPNAGPSYGGMSTGSERAIAVPIGFVTLDGATGDPIVPADALGWSSVAVAVVSLPMLARIGEEERAALREWTHAGGHLVLVPRTAADVSTPMVRELLGEIAGAPGRTLIPGELVPSGTFAALDCGARVHEERFGCAARVGHGIAYLVAYDLTSPPAVDQPATRELVRAIAQRAMRATGSPRLALGRGRDTTQDSGTPGARSLALLRGALDPNEGYRPALGLVAVVLLFYVILVGPLNFRFVLRRNRPTLALITTPIAALGCALLMLLVGYLGKGVITRYRRIEVIEAVEGSALAPSRAYTGLFLTRPSSIDLDTPPHAAILRIASGGDDGLVFDHGGARPRLTGMRGGLWETVFTRTDRVVDQGGAITFTTADRALVSVTNHGAQALRSAFLLDQGSVYVVGDIEPGATRPISRVPASSNVLLLPTSYYEDPSDRAPVTLAQHLGLGSDHERAVRGVIRALAAIPDTQAAVPVLWARLDPAEPPAASPAFSEESDLRLLLVRVALPYDPLGRAPEAPVDPSSIFGEPPPMIDPVLLAPPNDPAGVIEGEVAP